MSEIEQAIEKIKGKLSNRSVIGLFLTIFLTSFASQIIDYAQSWLNVVIFDVDMKYNLIFIVFLLYSKIIIERKEVKVKELEIDKGLIQNELKATKIDMEHALFVKKMELDNLNEKLKK
jgi:hypothetical protein